MESSISGEERRRAHQHLVALTLRYFSDDEFPEFLRRNGYEEVVAAIPRVDDQETYHRELIRALDRRGLLDARLLEALVGHAPIAGEIVGIADELGIRLTPLAPQLAVETLVETLRGSRLDSADFVRMHALGSKYFDILSSGAPDEPTSATLERLVTELRMDALPALAWLSTRIIESADVDSELEIAAAEVVDLAAGLKTAVETPSRASEAQAAEQGGSSHGPQSFVLRDDSTLPSRFLENGVAAARAVVLVSQDPDERSRPLSSGWLIAPSLVVVPAHIFPMSMRSDGIPFAVDDSYLGMRVTVTFNYDDVDSRAERLPATVEALDPRLDLGLIRLEMPMNDVAPLRVRTDAAAPGTEGISMIHHLQGGTKRLSLHGGQLLENDGHEVVYVIATGPGSAGAPLFDDQWRVIATHRAWRAYKLGDADVRAKSGVATTALLNWIRETEPSNGRLWREVVAAQRDLKTVDDSLRRVLSGPHMEGHPPRAALLIRVVDADHQLMETPDLRVDARIGTTVTATGTLRSLNYLAEDPGVLAIESSPTSALPECWNSVPHVKADIVHAEFNAVGERGGGALVAVIDNGMDVLHEAFLDAQGRTRVVAFWDQRDRSAPIQGSESARTLSGAARGAAERWNINYGSLYVQEDLQGFVDSAELPNSFPSREEMNHGTRVASVAAGRRTGGDSTKHFGGGVAPEAQLVVVRPDAEGESIGYAKGYIDALTFIDAVASEHKMPVVVNISAGMNAGSHDGSSQLERACETFLEQGSKEGRVIVKSAGNERQLFRHAKLETPQGTAKTLSWTTSRLPNGQLTANDVIEFWFSGENTYSFRLTPPSGRPTPEMSTSHFELVNANEFLENGNRFTTKFTPYHQDNGYGYLRLDVFADKKEIEPGAWSLQITAMTVIRNEPIHAWIELNPYRETAFSAEYATDEVTLTVPGTAAHVITVGATEIGEQVVTFPHSSRGPTRGKAGCEKPVIMAPGVGIRGAKGGSPDRLDDEGSAGTSYAAPHVTGAVALMLAARLRSNKTQLNASQVEMALKASANHKSLEWNDTTGYGVLDVKALLEELSKIP